MIFDMLYISQILTCVLLTHVKTMLHVGRMQKAFTAYVNLDGLVIHVTQVSSQSNLQRNVALKDTINTITF